MDMKDLEDVAHRYKKATDALDVVRTEMQGTAVALLQQDGVKQADVARVTGWSREHLRRLKEKAELEALRRRVDELSTTKTPRPAVAAPRQQVTQAVPEHVETVPNSVISPPVVAMTVERVKELAEAAEARHPEWIEQIRQAHPTADEHRLYYLIVEAGVRMGFRPRELDAKSTPDRPAGSEENTG
jgi:hypothetical protein